MYERRVVWDSHCTFCRRWVALFRALDWFRVHRFVGSADPVAFADGRVTPEDVDRALQLVTRRGRKQGFDAVVGILGACPLTFWAAPLLRLPPVLRAGRRAYDRVAARRTCSVV